jgi:uncharacterized repeat protein (TIGR01451 family)
MRLLRPSVPSEFSSLTRSGVVAFLTIFLTTLSLLPSSANADETSSLNTRLRPVSQTTGTLVIGMTGQFAPTPTDSFGFQKQAFTGTTTCGCTTVNFVTTCPTPTAGAPVTYISNVSAGSPYITSLATTDSIKIQPAPGSDRNGQGPGFQIVPNTDTGVTLTYLPGNAVCVALSDALTHTIKGQYSPGLQTMDATCTNPKFLFKPGDTVCVRASGTTATGGTPWHVNIYGGSINQCTSYPSLPTYPGTAITAETQNVTFTLPASNAAIPAGCAPGGGSAGTTDIRGNWQATMLDQSSTNRASDQFRVHDNNPSYDLSVYESVGDKTGNSNFPPAGFIKYSISVQNNGPDAAPNAQLVTSIPASTTFVSFTQTQGPQFTCGAPSGGNVTCTRSSFAADNYSSFEMVVSYSGQTNGALISNTATVSSTGTDFYSPNNTTGPPQTQAMITTNANVGQFICPADITVASTSASGAVVTYSSFTTTATYSGGSFHSGPNSGSTFPIGTTIVGWQSAAGSGSCFFNVNVTDGQRPDLVATKSHAGFFARGQKGAQYSWIVKNTGALSTLGAVTVVDPLQIQGSDFGTSGINGFIPTAMSGPGWTCTLSTISCSRSDALAGGASYPPITMSVNLNRYGVYNSNNHSWVYGGGEGVTTNDEADDQTGVIAPLGITIALKDDYNGDAHSDVILQNSSSGDIAEWQLNAAGTAIAVGTVVSTPGSAWKVIASGDFNSDGKADLVLQNSSTGDVAEYLMNGTAITSAGLVGSPGTSWKVIFTGDFNGDQMSDIVLQNSATGDVAVWQMNGMTIVTAALVGSPGTAYKVVGIGDFNGDGRSDIVLQNQTTGDVALWVLNPAGTALTSGAVLGGSGTVWQVVGTGDFNGDGRSDIALFNTSTGDVAIWTINSTGTAIATGAALGHSGLTWKVVGTGDFNADGRSDIALQNVNNGDVAVWQLNPAATAIATGTVVGGSGLVWVAQAN